MRQFSYSAAVTLVVCSLGSIEVSAAPTTGSAYFTDPQHSYVQDATSKQIDQVNMITCFMSSMRPDALVNQGDYVALVDQNKCDPQRRSGGNSGSSSDSSSQAPDYLTAVVNSTRASNAEAMRAKIWIDDTNENGPSTIFVNLSATQAPTSTNPYGAFRLDFCGQGAGMSQCGMQGYLEGSDTGLSYFQTESQGPDRSSITALKLTTTSGTTGSGRVDTTSSENNQTEEVVFNFAYNQDYFLRGDQCFARDANDPETGLSVWRYGLYDAVTGERVTRNSGFPIEYTAGGQTYRGYLGYWGLNLPPDATSTLTNGATVQKVDYGSGSSPTKTDYSVMIAGGKLTKYTKKTRTLHDLDKIKFDTFVNDVANFIPNATPNTQYEMYWDNASGSFKVTGQMSCDQNGCQTHDFDTEIAVGASFWASLGGVQGWSQSLGGDLFIELHGSGDTLDSVAINVTYRQQDLVYPSDMPAHLYCVNNCPTATSLTTYFSGNSQDPSAAPYAAGTFNSWMPSATYIEYASNTTSGLLTSGGDAVVFTDRDAYSQHQMFQSGVRSGRLFTDPTVALCPNSSTTYCDYQVNNADVYYVWETGPNNWNQFAAVKDSSGAFVTFDSPLQLSYTVPTGAAYGTYAGKSIVIQYSGFGELSGIPGECVSPLTNDAVPCGAQNARYVPAFVIPAGEQVVSGSNTYLVKWLDREIRFARKDLSVCTNASLQPPTGIVLPTAAVLKDPSNANSDIYIGTKPTVTAAPRVIQNDVKY